MERVLGLVKLFVVVAGILIIGGTVALIWLLVQRGGEPQELVRPVAVERPASAPAPEAELRADLAIPAGAAVIDVKLAGGQVLLLMRSLDGEEYLAMVDPLTGRRLSLLRLVPEVFRIGIGQRDGPFGERHVSTRLRVSPDGSSDGVRRRALHAP